MTYSPRRCLLLFSIGRQKGDFGTWDTRRHVWLCPTTTRQNSTYWRLLEQETPKRKPAEYHETSRRNGPLFVCVRLVSLLLLLPSFFFFCSITDHGFEVLQHQNWVKNVFPPQLVVPHRYLIFAKGQTLNARRASLLFTWKINKIFNLKGICSN